MIEKFKHYLSYKNFVFVLGFFYLLSFLIFVPVQGQDNLQYTGKILWDDPKIFGQNSISISKDGTYTAAVGRGGLTILDNRGTRLWTRTPLGDSKTIWSAAIADEGNYVVMGSSDKNAYFYNKAGDLLWTYQTGMFGIAGREVAGVGISRDGRSIAIGEGDGTIKLLNNKGSNLWSYSTDKRLALSGVAISSDGNYVAALSDLYNNVYFFDNTGKLLWQNHYAEYQGFTEGHGVAISNDGMKVVVGSTNNYVYCFNKWGNLLWKTDLGSRIGPVSISDDGSFIVAGSENKNIYLLDQNGKILWYYPTSETVEGVSITGDGSLIAGEVKERNAFVITNPNYVPQLTRPTTVSPTNTPYIASQKDQGTGGMGFGLVFGLIIILLIALFGTAAYLDKRNRDHRKTNVQNQENSPIDDPEMNGIWYGLAKYSSDSTPVSVETENVSNSLKNEKFITKYKPIQKNSPEYSRSGITENRDKRIPVRGGYAGICPRCGSDMVWRRAKKTGELYRGCTNYERGCRYQERSY